jgi:chromate transporter
VNDAIKTEPVEKLEKPRLRWIAGQFFKIGALGFGGGVAIIALMREQCVTRRKCLSDEEFLHGVSLGQFLGSFAVNSAFFIGYRMRGLIGGLTAATSFLAPSVSLVILLSALYGAAQKAELFQQAMQGASPVVLALILSAAFGLGKSALKTPLAWALAIMGLAGTLLHWPLAMLIVVGAGVGILFTRWVPAASPSPANSSEPHREPSAGDKQAPAVVAAGVHTTTTATALKTSAAGAATAAGSISMLGMLWLFLKIGCLFFGGGYVLVPLLQRELVDTRHLLSMQEFLNGVAISQLTPGPIAVLATFAGYRLHGVLGAILATAALYVPATVLMIIISQAYTRFRNLEIVQQMLKSIGAVIVGMIVASAVQLAPHSSISLTHPAGIILGIVAFVLLLRRWHPAFLLVGGALLGVFFRGAFV